MHPILIPNLGDRSDWKLCVGDWQVLKRDVLNYKRANVDIEGSIEHYDVLPQSRLNTIEAALPPLP